MQENHLFLLFLNYLKSGFSNHNRVKTKVVTHRTRNLLLYVSFIEVLKWRANLHWNFYKFKFPTISSVFCQTNKKPYICKLVYLHLFDPKNFKLKMSLWYKVLQSFSGVSTIFSWVFHSRFLCHSSKHCPLHSTMRQPRHPNLVSLTRFFFSADPFGASLLLFLQFSQQPARPSTTLS